MDSNKIVITPKQQLLTADALFLARNSGTSSVKSGVKRHSLENTETEKEDLRNLYDELILQISQPRINRTQDRTIAEWIVEKNAVKILKIEGKFETFGYAEDNNIYLNNYEALFLLELNRLELYFNEVLVSLEQAYSLLLGQEKSIMFDKYLIYATLSRSGYIVQSCTLPELQENESSKCFENDCVWEILKSKLNPNYKITENYLNSDTYKILVNKMENTTEKIRCESISNTESNSNSKELFNVALNKRKLTELKHKTEAKKRKLFHIPSGSLINNIDITTLEDFEDFTIIPLKVQTNFIYNKCRLSLDFDLYLPRESFRKSDPGHPNFRVIVIGHTDLFPSREELCYLNHQQQFNVPILVASVNESRHIQFFLYYFT